MPGQPTRTGRSWWRNEFYDHPGRAEKRDDAYLLSQGGTQVEKVYCIACFDNDLSEIALRDETDLLLGRRNNIRSRAEAVTLLWSVQKGYGRPPDQDYGYLRYAKSTLLNHVKTCSRQTAENRALAKHNSPRKSSTSGSVHQNIQPPAWPPPNAQPGTSQYSPQYYQMLPPSMPPSQSHSPALSTSSLSALPSPYIGLMVPMDQSPPLTPGYLTGNATPRSRSQSISINDPVASMWPVGFQRKFEERIARLTVSAGLPLSWVDNPEWIDFVHDFLPSARSPSRKVLTNRLIPTAAKQYRDATKFAAKNQNTTLQADGWTGLNFHHLLAFMIAFNKQAHTIDVHDASAERKTAENLVVHLENAIRIIRMEYLAILVAVVMDASGECRKASKILAAKYPDVVFLNCYAHQINLVVGDYFKSQTSVLKFSDQATELITWLRSKTQVLALLREVQELQARVGPFVIKAIIRAVLTRWTAHYLAYDRLLDLRKMLIRTVDTDELRLEKDRCVVAPGDAKSKKKAMAMVKLIRNETFWRGLLRMKLHLEPLAIAANVTQAAFCRLDTVLLTFGFLVMQYRQMTDKDDHIASVSIISSLEKRWMAADQDIFIAAVIVNPFFRAVPFDRNPRFVVAGIIDLLGSLYTRFFWEAPPPVFGSELREYLMAEGQYVALRATCIRHETMAEEQGKSPDPLEVYRDFSFSSGLDSPFHRLAKRLLSICTNSATCERLFSVFGNTLTKLRNRMGTSTLSSIAELKMHVCNEHRLASTKTRMKRMFTSRLPTPSDGLSTVAQPPSSPFASPTTDEATSLSIDEDLDNPDDTQCLRSGFHDLISDNQSGPAQDDEPFTYDSQGGKLTLSQLFNFEDAHWVAIYREQAGKGFDEELALYDLLNEDTGTGDDMEVDVDETTAEILIS